MSDLEPGLKKVFESHLAGTPPNLEESIRYSLLAPGKRIRPRLALACGEMLGLTREAVLPAAYAIEMIHCFTLIHDDLPCMDNDDFRRGKPSNHKIFGEAIALLAGDGLMSLAFDVYMDAAAYVPSDRLMAGFKRLNQAVGPRGVIGGQAAEPLLHAQSGLAELQKMHAMKTGALFSASLLVPMELAGISGISPVGRAIEIFASELGLGFQVADDLEDADEPLTPTSILHYLSADEAKRQTRLSLEKATQELQAQLGPKAEPLARIAGEVLRKL